MVFFRLPPRLRPGFGAEPRTRIAEHARSVLLKPGEPRCSTVSAAEAARRRASREGTREAGRVALDAAVDAATTTPWSIEATSMLELNASNH
jgi:hypothetical protein